MMAPTSPRSDPKRQSRAGFTLIELSAALVVIGLIAALALPRMFPLTSSSAIRQAAFDVAATLRADRTHAARLGEVVTTRFDTRQRVVTAGSDAHVLALEGRFTLDLGQDRASISFSPDGSSNGGTVRLSGKNAAYSVHVDAFSGAIDVVTETP